MSETPSNPDAAEACAALAALGAELARHAPFSVMSPAQVAQFIEAAQPLQFRRGFENVFGAACSLLRHQPHCLVTLLGIALDIARPAYAADDENGR